MCRNALHRQKVKKRKGSQNSIQFKEFTEDLKAYALLIFMSSTCNKPFPAHHWVIFFFHSVKAYNPSNYID